MLRKIVSIALFLTLTIFIVGCGNDVKKVAPSGENQSQLAKTDVGGSANTQSTLQKESDAFKRKYNEAIRNVPGASNFTISSMDVTDGSAFGLSHYEFSKDLMIDFYHDKGSKKVNEFMIKAFARPEYDDDRQRKNIDDGIAVFAAAIRAYDPNADVDTILDKLEARRPYSEWVRDTEFVSGGVTYYTEGATDLCTFGITK